MPTAETWGTGRLVLDSGDGETCLDPEGATGVRGIIELTQLQAGKGVCYRASFPLPRCNVISAATRPDTRERLRRGPVERVD